MAIGDAYATLEDLKTRLGPSFVGHTEWDTVLTNVLLAISRKTEKHCGRQFNSDGGAATARYFEPSRDVRLVEVDDFVLTDDFMLQTDPSGTGDFEVTWDAPLDYELSPFNGVVDGVPGWPYYRIRAIAGVWFPLIQFRRKATVKVTAQWGWSAVPDDVHEAVLILAESYFHLKDAPFGVAGFTSFGTSVKVRDNPMACSLLDPYRIHQQAIQIG